MREPNKPVLSVRMASGTESADAILATLFCQAGCAAGAGRAGVAEAPCQTGHLLSRLWLRHEVPARPPPPRPAATRGPILCLPDMIWNTPSRSAPLVPPCAKHDRPGSGGAWPRAREKPVRTPIASSNPLPGPATGTPMVPTKEPSAQETITCATRPTSLVCPDRAEVPQSFPQ